VVGWRRLPRVNRFLDQRPVLAGVLVVVGVGVALAAVALAGATGTEGYSFYVSMLGVFAGSWCANDGLRALIRWYRHRRVDAVV
jgi:hypothetical protein